MRETVGRVNLKWGELTFAYTKTDGHLRYDFQDGAWSDGEVVDDDTITLNISATCLHYGQEAFEGLKVYEAKDGRIITFRPDENGKRMEHTAERLMMAKFPADRFVDAVDKLVRINVRFVPPYGSGAALYIRPLLIGTSAIIGVKPSIDYTFLMFATPVGPYFKHGLKPVRLKAELEYDRAAPNGVGHAKAGGNYAAGMLPGARAKAAGFDECLYLDAKEKKYVDESGATNFFGITKDGTYITPDSTSILPSITNKSLMQLAKDMGIKVERRPIHIDELPELAEAGCVGTAAVITPVGEIEIGGKSIKYGTPGETGPVTKKLYDRLTGIQYGDLEDTHGWVREIKID
jgi:branched-chain amino acid aminotransferase